MVSNEAPNQTADTRSDNETAERPRPDLICQDCRIRPVMDRCSICDECWYAPRTPDRPLMPWEM